MEDGVIALGNELARAVEIIMNPVVSQADRMEAYVACERYLNKQFNKKNLI